jgi:hypothetical protein
LSVAEEDNKESLFREAKDELLLLLLGDEKGEWLSLLVTAELASEKRKEEEGV